MEKAPVRAVFKHALHPYTARLLKSIPKVGKKARVLLDAIRGTVPTPLNLPRRCSFSSRCTEAIAGLCDVEVPALVEVEEGHAVRCFLHSREKESIGE